MRDATATKTPPFYLLPIAGPPIDPIVLTATPGGQVMGRQEDCDLLLPADADKVSRRHARFSGESDGRWRIADLGSRWGTFLNGAKLHPDQEMPLAEGDLVRVVPWTFAFSSSPKRRPQMRPVDDMGQTAVRTIDAGQGKLLQGDMLSLLLEGTAVLHEATNEKDLAESVIDLATRGTGLGNAALLRPVDANGGVDVIAARFKESEGGVSFSRSLLMTALSGQVAELTPGDDVSQSIVQMRISAAMCIPLKLGDTVAALLYLDHRAGIMLPRPQAGAFAVALGRMASMALANLKRVQIERRAAEVEAELSAAAAAQKWIMPKRQSAIGPFTIIGESRAGQYVGGDFFDIIHLSDGKFAVALGDVSGHGIAAGVLMTATQGYLHAALSEHADVARAMMAVNRYVAARSPGSKFVTAWVGLFDPNAGTLTYVDAGHSYALVRSAEGPIAMLAEGSGLPIGVMDDVTYTAETVPLLPGGSVMLVSDGILEQREPVSREEFTIDRVQEIFAGANQDPVAELFEAVFAFGATKNLTDDATAVLVRW